MIVSVDFSRVALGAHSLNQVLYGTQVGLWLAFTLFTYMRPRLQVHLKQILEFDNREFVVQRQGSVRNCMLYYIAITITVWLFVIMLTVINFITATKYTDYPDLWIHAIIDKCSGGNGESAVN